MSSSERWNKCGLQGGEVGEGEREGEGEEEGERWVVMGGVRWRMRVWS